MAQMKQENDRLHQQIVGLKRINQSVTPMSPAYNPPLSEPQFSAPTPMSTAPVTSSPIMKPTRSDNNKN